MDTKTFKAQWRDWYRNGPPVGHLLRVRHPEAWLRIHSLPDAQRYPASASDWKELLTRHNAVATELLGESGPCVLVIARYGSLNERVLERLEDFSKDKPKVLRAMKARLLGLVDDTWLGPEPLDEDSRFLLYAAPLVWRSGAHDALLRVVAENNSGPVLIVSLESGRVYAPYDGGADLFFSDPAERQLARERYRPWLSPHPSGL